MPSNPRYISAAGWAPGRWCSPTMPASGSAPLGWRPAPAVSASRRASTEPATRMTAAQVADVLRRAGCVFAEAEAELLVAAPGPLEVLLSGRVAGEPLEQVLGWAEFDGQRVRLCRALRAQAALAAAGSAGRRTAGRARPRGGPVLRQRGAGHGAAASGCRDRAVRRRPRPGRGGVCPGQPAGRLRQPGRPVGRVAGGTARTGRGDPGQRAVVPSARIAWMPPEARDHEPLAALDGGPDGLDLHRRIASEAASWLEPGGLLLIEVAPTSRLGHRNCWPRRASWSACTPTMNWMPPRCRREADGR